MAAPKISEIMPAFIVNKFAQLKALAMAKKCAIEFAVLNATGSSKTLKSDYQQALEGLSASCETVETFLAEAESHTAEA